MATASKEKASKERQGGLLDLRLRRTRSRSWLESKEREDFLRVWLGGLDQRLPSLCLHLLHIANFGPVDVLLAISNQGDGPFNTNLQAFLSKIMSEIFFNIEALGQFSKSFGFFFLREEIWEKLRQA